MEFTTTLLPLATAFGFALLHSLWMGALLYALVRSIAPMLPSATGRYFLAYVSLWLLAAGFGYTLYDGYYVAPICENLLLAAPPFVFNGGTTITTPVQDFSLADTLSHYAPWISLSYLLGFIPACLILWRNQRAINRLRSFGLSNLPERWSANISDTLAAHPATRRVKIYLSDRANEVMSIGFWSPIIILPVALANQLSPEMARTLLLHEIAHLRQYDHLMNYPQQFFRVLFFYHPAVHALSRFIDREREHRCDDWVAGHCDDRRTYATALVTVARYTETINQSSNLLAMSATKTPFSSRIHRLFGGPETPKTGQFALSAFFIVALGLGHFGFTTQGAAAGAVDCLEEQSLVSPTPAPSLLLPTTDLPPMEVANSPKPKAATIAPPPAPLPRNAAPAAAPSIPTLRIDTISPKEFEIRDDDPTSQEIPAIGGKQELARDAAAARSFQGTVVIRIDGQLTEKKSLSEIDGENIEKLSVVKDKQQLRAMGFGNYDALLDVTTLKEVVVPNSEQNTATVRYKDPDNIAYFLDGKRIFPNPINDLDPSTIVKIDVVKDPAMMKAAGLQEYEGAIYITSKDN